LEYFLLLLSYQTLALIPKAACGHMLVRNAISFILQVEKVSSCRE